MLNFKEYDIPKMIDKSNQRAEFNPEMYYYFSYDLETVFIHRSRNSYEVKGFGPLLARLTSIRSTPLFRTFYQNKNLQYCVFFYKKVVNSIINNIPIQNTLFEEFGDL